MTVYTDGITFFHNCMGVNDNPKHVYYSCFYKLKDEKTITCQFYPRCNFSMPSWITLGSRIKYSKRGFFLSYNSEALVRLNIDFNIYKPIEI